MEKERRARIEEAKRELDEILQSLIGKDGPGNDKWRPVAIFTGPVHIAHLVQCANSEGEPE